MNGRSVLMGLVAAVVVMATGSCEVAVAQDSSGSIALDSHEASNDGAAGPVESPPLAAGQAYAVTVGGTWSAWNAQTWGRNDAGSTPCGAPEDSPVTPSPGVTQTKVGQDAEWLFGRPWPPPCESNHPSIPYTYPGFQINTGSGWVHPAPVGGSGSAPASNHTYTYVVQGQGIPAQFRLVDSNTTDNSGVLTIRVAPQSSVQAPSSVQTSASRTCAATGGFRTATAAARGHGARLAFARRVRRRVGIDVFQTSIGRRVIGERLIARYRNLDHSKNWNGVANRRGRRVTDGYYFVRYRMVLPGGVVDTRRVTLRRVKGRFTKRPQFYRRASCGLISSYKLERPVFGGQTSRAVGVAYRVGRTARVRVTVIRGTHVVRRYPVLTRRAHRTFRLRFDAERRPVANYRFRLTAVDTAGRRVTATLVSRRL